MASMRPTYNQWEFLSKLAANLEFFQEGYNTPLAAWLEVVPRNCVPEFLSLISGPQPSTPTDTQTDPDLAAQWICESQREEETERRAS